MSTTVTYELASEARNSATFATSSAGRDDPTTFCLACCSPTPGGLPTEIHSRSYRSQCHGRRHPRRSNGRHQAGERANQDGRGDAARPRLEGDHDGPALRAGVHGRCRGPGQHADDAADNGEQDRLTEELRPDLALRRTKGATEADLRAAFQNRYDHDVGDTDGTHDQCHHPEPEKEAVERPRRIGPGGERVGRLAYGQLG